MKTLLASALFALTALAAPIAQAGPASGAAKPSAQPNAHGLTAFVYQTYRNAAAPHSLKVAIIKQEAAPVKARILDAHGAELMVLRIAEDRALQPFNLAALAPGTYQLELSRGGQVAVETFEVR